MRWYNDIFKPMDQKMIGKKLDYALKRADYIHVYYKGKLVDDEIENYTHKIIKKVEPTVINLGCDVLYNITLEK